MNKVAHDNVFGTGPKPASDGRLSVFLDFESSAYENWRRNKLASLALTDGNSSPVIEVEDPLTLTAGALERIADSLEALGFAIYRLAPRADSLSVRELLAMCARLGLARIDRNRCAYEDGVTRLQTSQQGERQFYIPYSNKGLNWHTDGYYNEGEHRIRSFVLHCIRNAEQGGESFLYDPELLYLQMRDEDPELVQALLRPDALTIPENAIDACNLRSSQTGPVFWVDEASGGLQMRYTARTRSIAWNPDQTVRRAVTFIRDTLENSGYVQKYKLKAGEGVISNNCLHGRRPFEDSDSDPRLLFRARFYDRISIANSGNTRYTGSGNQVAC
ncbi:MAG: TauD/TfdA family dioxygenase [Gammaproteobacteria bacterium]|nr:TauD/TfdA family dioxygenase [Gammaproteobacteria bacterium]